MIVDEVEIISKTARRLGMPTTQVARVVDVYLDEHLAASRASRVAADLAADNPSETAQDSPAAAEGGEVPKPKAKRVRKASSPKLTLDDFREAAKDENSGTAQDAPSTD